MPLNCSSFQLTFSIILNLTFFIYLNPSQKFLSKYNRGDLIDTFLYEDAITSQDASPPMATEQHFYDFPLSVCSLMPASLIQFDSIWMQEIRERADTLLLLNRPPCDKPADKVASPEDKPLNITLGARRLDDRHLSKNIRLNPNPNVSGFSYIVWHARHKAWQHRPQISARSGSQRRRVRCCSTHPKIMSKCLVRAPNGIYFPPWTSCTQTDILRADTVNGKVKKRKEGRKEDRRQTEGDPGWTVGVFVPRDIPQVRGAWEKGVYLKWQVDWVSVCVWSGL